MFALRSVGKSHSGDVVLPRWLRKPARMAQRMRLGDMEPPPFAATMATAVLFAFTGLYGALQGGHMDAVLQAATARVGFAINDVVVSGNKETSEIDVLQQIGLDGWTSMVGFDVQAARQRIAELPWVESATVRKAYPATLEVAIIEREPFALWQQGSEVSVIEEDGDIIAPFSGGHHAVLPLVIGVGANATASQFIQDVSKVRGLAGRVRAYIRVADRRWDLRLDNGLTIKLPEKGVRQALAEVSGLDTQYALFSRDVTAIDMRLSDRITVALGDAAVERREAEFEELQAKRKNGARI